MKETNHKAETTTQAKNGGQNSNTPSSPSKEEDTHQPKATVVAQEWR
jgi:hypothetical protein